MRFCSCFYSWDEWTPPHKWTVTGKYIEGRRMYIATRALDGYERKHIGDVEHYGEYSEDKGAVERLAEELNASEEKDRMAMRAKERMSASCPNCHDNYYPRKVEYDKGIFQMKCFECTGCYYRSKSSPFILFAKMNWNLARAPKRRKRRRRWH